MGTAEDYRRFADECLKWAREAKTDDERQRLLEMANTWVQAAARQDGRAPVAPGVHQAKT